MASPRLQPRQTLSLPVPRRTCSTTPAHEERSRTMADTPRASRNPLKRLFARKKDRKNNLDLASQVNASASAVPSVNISPQPASDDGDSTKTDTTVLPADKLTNPPIPSATLLPAAGPSGRRGSQGSATRSDPTQPLNFWEIALASLAPQDQKLLRKYSPTDQSDSAQLFTDILEAACEKRDAVESKKWTAYVMGRQVSVRSQADLVIRWLDRFKAVGDVAANADPIMAGLPWAAVRFLVQAAVSDQAQLDALFTGLERVTYVLNRCNIYTQIYTQYISTANAAHNAAMRNFEAGLTELYQHMLRFLVVAIQIASKSSGMRFLQALWQPDEVVSFAQSCQMIEERVEIELHNLERLLNERDHETVARHLEKLYEELKEIKSTRILVDTLSVQMTSIWESMEDESRTELLLWLSDIPYRDHHHFATFGRAAGTGLWLLEHSDFTSWQKSPTPRILWLHGIPGAGKTKLVTRVVDEVMSRPFDDGLAYFYCNHAEDTRRSADMIVRSLIKQLAVGVTKQEVNKRLVRLYKTYKSSGFASKHITFKDAQLLLPELLQAFPRVYIVIDALDECYQEDRSKLVDLFNGIIKKLPKAQLKIFISSRRNDDIRRQLRREANIGVEATDNQDDIVRFVNNKLEEDGARRIQLEMEPIPEILKDEIANVFEDRSGGMFQWASLHITQLLRLELVSDIRATLGQFPEGLKEAYDAILETLKSQRGSKAAIGRRALQWMLSLDRLLHIQFLIQAVSQDPAEDGINSVHIDEAFLLGACQNLLVVDSKGYCRFSHLSVEEYLSEHAPWDESESHRLILKVCLRSLTWADHTLDAVPDLLRFAAIYWRNYLRGEDEMDEDERLPERVFSPRVQHFPNTEMDHESMFEQDPPPEAKHDAPGTPDPEYNEPGTPNQDPFITLMEPYYFDRGFYRDPGKTKTSRKRQEYLQSPALLRPPKHNLLLLVYDDIFVLLKDRSKECTRPLDNLNNEEDSPLDLSFYRRQYKAIDFLLDIGAAMDEITALRVGLYKSIHCGQPGLLRFLLERGVSARAYMPPHATARMHGGYFRKKYSRIKMHSTKTYSTNALVEASHHCCLDTMRLLMEHGARIEDTAGLYTLGEYGHPLTDDRSLIDDALRNALEAAVLCPQGTRVSDTAEQTARRVLTVIEFLLQSGAEINPTINNPLIAAASRGILNRIEFLIDYGSDPNCEIDAHRSIHTSALDAALENNHYQAAYYLIEKGAHVGDIFNHHEFHILLAWVAFYRDAPKLRFLLSKCSEDNDHPQHWRDSVLEAATHGQASDLELANILLFHFYAKSTRGVDPNGVIEFLSGMGKTNFVWELLQTGSDVNARTVDSFGDGAKRWNDGSALAAAARRDREETMLMLIEEGADYDMLLDRDCGSALARASLSGQARMIWILVEAGANVDLELTGRFGTALQAAIPACLWDMYGFDILVEKADVHVISGGDFGSALATAAFFGVELAMEILLEKGADPNADLPGFYGSALAAATHRIGGSKYDITYSLDTAIQTGQYFEVHQYKRRFKAFDLLLANGAMINTFRGNPLETAIVNGSLKAVKSICARKADVNARTSIHGSPLCAAAARGEVAIIDYLCEKGANVDLVADGITPLAAAAKSGGPAAVDALLRRGADPNVRLEGEFAHVLDVVNLSNHPYTRTERDQIESALREAGAVWERTYAEDVYFSDVHGWFE